MSIYVLVYLSFTAFCWFVAMMKSDSGSEALAIFLLLCANVLAIVFQSIAF